MLAAAAPTYPGAEPRIEESGIGHAFGSVLEAGNLEVAFRLAEVRLRLWRAALRQGLAAFPDPENEMRLQGAIDFEPTIALMNVDGAARQRR